MDDKSALTTVAHSVGQMVLKWAEKKVEKTASIAAVKMVVWRVARKVVRKAQE